MNRLGRKEPQEEKKQIWLLWGFAREKKCYDENLR